MWTEKYRFRSSVSSGVLQSLHELINSDRRCHVILCGPPGTGKTSAIETAINSSPSWTPLELNGSDARGMDTVRKQIQPFASMFPPQGSRK